MTNWPLAQATAPRFENTAARASRHLLQDLFKATSRTGIQATAIACTLGAVGSLLAGLVAALVLAASVTSNSMLTGAVDGPGPAIQLAPAIWGIAFLGAHTLFLAKVKDPDWHTPLGLTVFAGLAFLVSLLFAMLAITLLGFGILALVIAYMMGAGFCLTAIGLVLRTVWNRHCDSGAISPNDDF